MHGPLDEARVEAIGKEFHGDMEQRNLEIEKQGEWRKFAAGAAVGAGVGEATALIKDNEDDNRDDAVAGIDQAKADGSANAIAPLINYEETHGVPDKGFDRWVHEAEEAYIDGGHITDTSNSPQPRLVTMRRLATLAALTFVLLGVGACTSDKGKDAAAEATPDDSTCKQLLGDAGLKWLKERTGDKAGLKVESDLKTARSLFHQQIENFYRKAKEPGPKDPLANWFQKAEVCESKKDFTKRGKELEILYGPAATAFDHNVNRASNGGFKIAETPVNSDVKLVDMTDPGGKISYTLQVKCKIPGTPAEQANEIPLEGQMLDTLTGETSARIHYTHLLHSAKVVANTFGCENKPAVPTEPPASVK
ncbi:hypothetical protein [Streptomyces sp. NBC_00259]|uniref:hypothetical protein n=1 Tax=Streptomyces sp. NBC_00259 TaxID=2903643 RepID=UPI002E28A386|nr:hypothetical protein [Streptomyces sp. NBC_00259]